MQRNLLVNNMEGLLQVDPITIIVRSGRKYDSDAVKRRRNNPVTNVAMFVNNPKIRHDDFHEYAHADSDARLFGDVETRPQFFGISTVTGEALGQYGVQTVAVAGTVNILNTSKWRIHQFDRIIAALPKKTALSRTIINSEWKDPFANPLMNDVEPCAIICPDFYKDQLGENYHIYEIGMAVSSDRPVMPATNFFALMLPEACPVS